VPDAGAARLYLVTPPSFSLSAFPERLAALLDGWDVACVRLALASTAEDEVMRAADALREVCHPRDVALVVSDHFRLARRLGLDGVHLTDGPRQVRAARQELSAEAIVGAYAHVSRHDGMTAAEAGADYVSFGPLTASSLGDGRLAPLELFEWWAEMIELPCVAEGGLTPDLAGLLASVADFVCLGDELWSHPDGPEAALALYAERISEVQPTSR
jgi:thiamine-phosphate pyrophosphorylase